MSHTAKKSLSLLTVVTSILFLLMACINGGTSEPPPLQKAGYVDLKIIPHKNANTDATGQAIPLVTRVYQIKDPQDFLQQEFDTLFYKDGTEQSTFGKVLAETSILPDQTQRIIIPLDKSHNYIGAVVGYNSLGSREWRTLVMLDDTEKSLISNTSANCYIFYVDLEISNTGTYFSPRFAEAWQLINRNAEILYLGEKEC